MSQSKLFTSLLPSHPDLLPILQEIREKYAIPEIGPEDEGIHELLLSDSDLNLEEIQKEIYQKVREIPDLFPAGFINILQHYETRTEDKFIVPGLDCLPEDSRIQVEAALQLMYQSLIPVMESISKYYDDLTLSIFEFLFTGEAREIPSDWLGEAKVISFMGQPMVMAMAGEFSNPKEIMDKFRFEYTKTFGKDRPKFTDGQLNTAEYLAMKMAGKSIADIADIYIMRHPSQFPKDFRSKEYREAKRKLEERLKKRMQRLENDFYKLLGDKK